MSIQNKFKTGNDAGGHTRYKPGNVPWNKGRKYQPGGRTQENWFRPGHQPTHCRPVGSTRINSEGNIEIKVAEGNQQWRRVARETWKQHHGEYPPASHVIRLRDGKNDNLASNQDINNLVLVSRKDLMRKNSVQNLPEPVQEVIAIKRWITRKIKIRKQVIK